MRYPLPYAFAPGNQLLLEDDGFNNEVARQFGLADFANLQFEPVGMIDCSGQTHQFHFQTRLLGDIVSLDAIELRQGSPGGHQFQVLGDSEGDLFALLERLIEKIRRTLSIKHIAEDGHGLQIVVQTARGRIDWDENEVDHVPLVVVDGQEIRTRRLHLRHNPLVRRALRS
jgi:hypothetical protein